MDESEGEENIGEVGDADGTIEITIDSGAANSVWPKKKKKGVARRSIVGKKPRLMAANGTEIYIGR